MGYRWSTDGVHKEYRWGTDGVQMEYRWGTDGVQMGYRQSTDGGRFLQVVIDRSVAEVPGEFKMICGTSTNPGVQSIHIIWCYAILHCLSRNACGGCEAVRPYLSEHNPNPSFTLSLSGRQARTTLRRGG